jgi:hypothetical protein
MATSRLLFAIVLSSAKSILLRFAAYSEEGLCYIRCECPGFDRYHHPPLLFDSLVEASLVPFRLLLVTNHRFFSVHYSSSRRRTSCPVGYTHHMRGYTFYFFTVLGLLALVGTSFCLPVASHQRSTSSSASRQ